MHVEQFGTGKTIYFGLHGWGGDHATFVPLLKHLPESVRFYCADLPGYGKSPAPQQWSLEHVTGEIIAAIAEIQATDITLVGNCSGAILALLAAQALKERVNRLILIDPFAYMPLYFRIFVEPKFGKIAYYSAFANPIGRWLTNLSLQHRRSEESNLTRSFQRVDHEVTWQYLHLLRQVRGIGQFADLHIPIDIVCGAKTFKAVKQSAQMFQRIWSQARVIELQGAGHLPIEEATEQLSCILFQDAEFSTPGSELVAATIAQP